MEKKPETKRPGKTRVFLISLATAFVFWFFNALNSPSERFVSLPMHYGRAPVDVRIINQLPSQVRVTVEGRGFGFLSTDLATGFLPVEVDLSRIIPGVSPNDTLEATMALNNLLTMNPVLERIPAKLIRTEPDSIVIKYTGNFTARVPLVADLELQFRKQYMLDGKVQVKPDSVEISGAPDDLRRVAFIKTKPLSIADLHKNIQVTAALDLEDHGIAASLSEVTVYVPVSEFAEGRIAVTVTGPAVTSYPLVMIPSAVYLTYRTPLRKFGSIGPSDFAVGLQHLHNDPVSVNRSLVIPVKVPEKVAITSIDPPWVEYYYLQ